MIVKSEFLVKNPVASVIIPSYNRVDTVVQTLESILNQKCDFDFEIVIGDDCSTDNVRELLMMYQEKYPSQIVLLFHEKNVGLAANWAICMQNCRGKYVANCDNDDFWHNPDKLKLQVDFMEAHPEYGVCHTNYRVLNRKNGHFKEVEIDSLKYNEDTLQKSIFIMTFQGCNVTFLYRKEVLLKYLNLNDFIKYQFTFLSILITIVCFSQDVKVNKPHPKKNDD